SIIDEEMGGLEQHDPDSLKTVSITGGEIRENAFYGCDSIETIIIQDSITTIGMGAFAGCSSLESISLPLLPSGIEGGFDFAYMFLSVDENNKGELCIPQSLKRVTITGGEVRENAFDSCDSIETIIIQGGITSIGQRAFRYCSSLSNIVIPNSVTSIGDYAFDNCTSLTNIVIPNSVTNIGLGAFAACDGLTSITLPFVGDGTSAHTHFGYIFGAETMYQNGSAVPESLKTVIITGGEAIADDAFIFCEYIETVVLPEGLKTIGVTSFQDCFALSTINIPSTVTSIGHFAFMCTGLTRVDITSIAKWCDISFETKDANPLSEGVQLYLNGVVVENLVIPKEVTLVNDYAFYHATQLKTVSFETNSRCENIDKSAFEYCTNITSISLPASLVSIGAGAFTATTNLVRVDITDLNAWLAINFADIDSNPTNHNAKLYLNGELVEDISLTEGVTSIGSYALTGLDVETLVVPSTVTTIGSNAFYSCTSLTEVVIPNSVTSIGAGALAGCTAIESLSIPFTGSGSSENTDLGHLFGGVDNAAVPASLKTVTITGDGSIPEAAFANCGNIETIILSDGTVIANSISSSIKARAIRTNSTGITSIGSMAFYNCYGLKEIVIPNSVQSIGFGAFDGCDALTSISLPFVGDGEDNTHFGYIFGGASYSDNSTVVPTTLKTVSITYAVSIGANAFYNCARIRKVYLPEGLISIGASAFKYCNNIDYINIPSTLKQIGSGAFSKSEWECERYVVDIASLASWCAIEFGDVESNLFNVCTTIHVNGREVTNLVIPKEVTAISPYAFYMSPGIDKVSFEAGSKCTIIGDNAFGSAEIESISLPEGLISIGAYAFEWCTNLTKINIPSTVTSIGEHAFANCGNISRINIVDIAAWCNISFADEYATPVEPGVGMVYLNGSLLTDLVIPKEVEAIQPLAFYGFNIETLSFEASSQCTSIGFGAFVCCMSLQDITIPSSVTTIGVMAFAGCASLTNMVIPNTVTSIGMGAFAECSSLESISAPLIGDGSETSDFFVHLFYVEGEDADNSIPETLKTVTITGGNVADSAFVYCPNIETIIIEDGITSIGQDAFITCESLITINIPSTVTTIGESAFGSCTNLARVNITDLDAWNAITFDDDTSNPLYYGAQLYLNGELVTEDEDSTVLVINNSVTSIEDGQYMNNTDITTVIFEEGSQCTFIGASAFAGCTNLTSIVMPSSITYIAYGAFDGCDSLERVSITNLND
ncbi:MAG: leucine-rich repeat domain-containing protein, partial [Clostridia bacterium]|nr:leucine-rich repeat domain-containing protein [Clostridia bacterium]